MELNKIEIIETDELVHRYIRFEDYICMVPETCHHLIDILNKLEKPDCNLLQKLFVHAESVSQGLFKAILRDHLKKPDSEVEETLVNLDPSTMEPEDAPLINDLRTLVQENRLFNAGISFARHGQIAFNPNNVIEFYKAVTKVVEIDQRIMIYNWDAGTYEELTEYNLGVITRFFMNRAYPGSWRSSYERDILEGLRRSAPLVKRPKNGQLKVCLKNGVIDLISGAFSLPSPDYFQTSQVQIKYDPNAECPRFEKYLTEITCGDRDLADVIQEMTGYGFIDNTKAEKAFFLYGCGQNGKSVYASVLIALLGKENVSSTPINMFGKSFGLEDLPDKLVNISSENETAGNIGTEALKGIISGDTLAVNRKYKTPLNYPATCKLFFIVNTPPDVADTTHGFFRKIMIIPFNRIFSDDEKNPNLKDELMEELPGILNWALEGAKRLIKNKYRFSGSDAIEKAVMDYKAEQNPVESFYKDGLVYKPGAKTPRKDIIEAYVKWLENQGTSGKGTESPQKFWGILGNQAKMIDKRNLEYVQIHGNKHLTDYAISEDLVERTPFNFI